MNEGTGPGQQPSSEAQPVGAPPAAQHPPVAWTSQPQMNTGRGFNWGDFFAFRFMITPVLIRVIYAIGFVLITLGAIVSVGSAGNAGIGILFGIVVFVIGQLYWRVVMELFMVFFGMHESLRAIERQGR